MRQLPSFLHHENDNGNPTVSDKVTNPFQNGPKNMGQWEVNKAEKQTFDNIFYTLPGSAFEDGGKVRGSDCVGAMTSRSAGIVGKEDLFKIWSLVDPKNEGSLDDERFAVAMYIIDEIKEGKPCPDKLRDALVPPKMRSWDAGML